MVDLHRDVVEIAVNVQSRLDSGTTSDGVDPRSGVGLRDTNSRDVLALGTWRHTKGTTGERCRSVVIDNCTNSTGSTSKSRLETKLASTTLDERDLALYLSRVVGGLATQFVDRDELGGDVATGRVLEECGVVLGAITVISP